MEYEKKEEEDVLCSVVVVGLDLIELEVEQVLRVEGGLVGNCGLYGGSTGGAVEIEVASETSSACRL